MGIRAQKGSLGDLEPRFEVFDSRALLVTLGCLLGAVYSSYLLYQDIQNRGARTGTPMAKLAHIQKKVRLKPAQSFVWGSVKANEDLYPQDSIQTAPNGAASVKFTDGTMLEIGENSLIIIDTVENLSMNFLRGSVVVRSQSGDSRITIGQDGKTIVEKLPIRMISPEPLSDYFIGVGARKTVAFSWETNLKPGEAVPDTIEVSTTREFHPPGVATLKLEAGKNTGQAKLPAGDYFWRLTARSRPLTQASRFTVGEAVPLKPLFPTASQKVPSFGGEGAVQFRWHPITAAADDADDSAKIVHHLEVAADPGFKTVLATQEIAAASGIANMKAIPEGTRYWRIVSEYPGLTVKSAEEKFQLDKVGKVSLDLSRPGRGEILEASKPVHFGWSADSTRVEYRWQVRPADSPEKIESVDVKGVKSHTWSAPAPGLYQWHVQALYAEQVVGESAWQDFSSFAPYPLPRAPASAKSGP